MHQICRDTAKNIIGVFLPKRSVQKLPEKAQGKVGGKLARQQRAYNPVCKVGGGKKQT